MLRNCIRREDVVFLTSQSVPLSPAETVYPEPEVCRKNNVMYKIVMITSAVIVGIGWIAYGFWRIAEHFQERKRPKPTTKHLQHVKKSFDEYIKKVEKYEKPTYKRE